MVRDLIQEILSTLKHNKLRMALTGFAISWGIFMLIILLSMTNGVINSFNAQLGGMNFDNLTIWGGQTQMPYNGLDANREISLKESDTRYLSELNSQDIKEIIPEANMGGNISSSLDYIASGVSGTSPVTLSNAGLKLTAGRFINQLDMDRKRKVMVLPKKNADVLFKNVNPVGQNVNFNSLSFTIIGVYDHKWNQQAYIPYTTLKAITGNTDTVQMLTATLRPIDTEEDGQTVEKNVRATLAKNHNFNPEDQGAVWIRNGVLDRMRMTGAMSGLDLAMWLIGILTLLSGIVGVSNIMFVSVKERTHEIGVRRAMGARPAAILRQIILESVAITTLFGYIGIIAGVGLTSVITKIIGPNDFILNPTISLNICFEVTILLIIAGSLAGLFPALKALKVKPVEALRDE